MSSHSLQRRDASRLIPPPFRRSLLPLTGRFSPSQLFPLFHIPPLCLSPSFFHRIASTVSYPSRRFYPFLFLSLSSSLSRSLSGLLSMSRIRALQTYILHIRPRRSVRLIRKKQATRLPSLPGSARCCTDGCATDGVTVGTGTDEGRDAVERGLRVQGCQSERKGRGEKREKRRRTYASGWSANQRISQYALRKKREKGRNALDRPVAFGVAGNIDARRNTSVLHRVAL